MGIRPVLHRIFVKPDSVKDSDDIIKRAEAAGLTVQLDKREQKAQTTGIIVAIGNTAFESFGSTSEKENITVGSKVIYAKYAGAEVPNSDLILINDEDIVGVYTDD